MHRAAALTYCVQAFKYAQYDPVAVVFGAHMFVIGAQQVFLTQLILGTVGIVCAAVYSSLHAVYLQTCCYAAFPPSGAAFRAEGACDDPASLAAVGGSACVHAAPASHAVLLFFTIVTFIADGLVYMHYYKVRHPCCTIVLCLRPVQVYEAEVRERLASETGARKAVRALMLFPITGIVLGSYEHVTRFAFVYYVRLLLLTGGVLMSMYMYVSLVLNYAWGCYPSFLANSDGNMDELVAGRCDDAASAIAQQTQGGHFRLWDTSLVVWCCASVVWMLWLALYAVRWIGWPGHMPTLPDELVQLLGH